MISNTTKPKNKYELSRSINNMKNPDIEVIEVFDNGQKRDVTNLFDKMIRKGSFSLIYVREK